jgi:hypothetical protein
LSSFVEAARRNAVATVGEELSLTLKSLASTYGPGVARTVVSSLESHCTMPRVPLACHGRACECRRYGPAAHPI